MNGVTKGENVCDEEEGTSTEPEGTPGGGGAAVGPCILETADNM